MSYDEIINELKSNLSGDYNKDSEYLRKAGDKFGKEGNTDGVRAVGEIIFEIMPENEKQEITNLTHIDGVRMDKFYEQINSAIHEKNMIEAKSLAEKLYAKIMDVYKETDKAKFVTFRNPFEDNLAQLLFKTDKILNRAPFDFATYLTTYAFIIIETGSPIDAVHVLEEAIAFNPVDCGPRFELAEAYKLMKNKDKLIEVTQQTLRIASSPIAIARCYANMGYLCVDLHELDDAVNFYTASVTFAPHPAIPLELKGIAQMKGSDIKQPTHDEIMATMKKYNISFGPDKDVISVAAQLASTFLLNKDMRNAVMSLKMLYNLTQDEKIKDMILKYDPSARRVNADGTAPEGSVPDNN
ncbi:MAG: tetratricopeptide repeat protein [Oscillospiraceae bacterium]|nr:tetratricopeptide repeat protein [Oscillospiraceae bacterium]